MAVSVTIDTQTLLPWTEAITYRSVKVPGDETATMTYGARYPLTAREAAASYGAYVAGDVNWTIQQSELTTAGFTPKPRDRITDSSSNTWTVLDATYSPVLLFWKVTTRNLSIAHDLRDVISIELPTDNQGDTGAVEHVWSVAYQGLPARVQVEQGQEFTGRGKRAVEQRYAVYLDRQLTPYTSDGDFGRVVLADGTYLDIESYEQGERISDLPVLRCFKAA